VASREKKGQMAQPERRDPEDQTDDEENQESQDLEAW